MKSVLAIRHVPFEDLGIFADVFESTGHTIQYLDAGLDDLSAVDPLAADIVVVLGAPIGANDEDAYPFLTDELRILHTRIEAQRPVLGICLGAQLMARVLGAKVYPGTAKEIGFSPLTFTPEGRNSALSPLEGKPVLHWHGDTFSLPQGAVRLASTPITENQAFAFGPTALALQFHPEADPRCFERWLIGHAYEIAATPTVSVTHLRKQMSEFGSASAVRGKAFLSEWLAQLSSKSSSASLRQDQNYRAGGVSGATAGTPS